jgi:(1->4)-alpha-D-glucan 1-alpha-D-glucosylmutase
MLLEAKRSILTSTLVSELVMLSQLLLGISLESEMDFTREQMERALRAVISCFPVYRTYIEEEETPSPSPSPSSSSPYPSPRSFSSSSSPIWPSPSSEDLGFIESAVSEAKERKLENVEEEVFEFLKEVLTCQKENGLTTQQVRSRRNFISRFQQVTGPVMAKGLEVCSFLLFLFLFLFLLFLLH